MASAPSKRFIKTFFFTLFVVGLFTLPFSVFGFDATSTSFYLESADFDTLSGLSSSTSFSADQHAPYINGGLATSTNFLLDSGFSLTSSTATSSGGGSGGSGGGGGGGGGGSSGFVGGGGTLPNPPEPVYYNPPITDNSAQNNNQLESGKTNPAKEPSKIAGIFDAVKETIKGIFLPKPKPFILSKIDLEKVVPRVGQKSFSMSWTLVDPTPIRELVFRPLPVELRNLAGEIPQIGKLFAEVGITKFNDLQKLKNISLKIPGLTDALSLPAVKVTGGSVAPVKNIAIKDLTPELRSKFPKGVLFAKFSGGLIDVKPHLSLASDGSTNQVIRTIVGSTLSLSVRPIYEAKAVDGYIVFKGKTKDLSGSNYQGSIINSALASQKSVTFSTALVLSQFSFVDPDKDGIFTASVQAPLVSSEYEVLTAITYKDSEKGTQLLRMITLVDPEGYVYESVGGKEIRIPGSIVTLEWLNPEKKAYEVWPASDFQQENPQITNMTGQYSFLVPEGNYRLTVDAPGYKSYEGKPFEVREGGGIHENIQLGTSFQFFKSLDWKTAGIAILFLLVLYNFYKDKRRDYLDKKAISP